MGMGGVKGNGRVNKLFKEIMVVSPWVIGEDQQAILMKDHRHRIIKKPLFPFSELKINKAKNT